MTRTARASARSPGRSRRARLRPAGCSTPAPSKRPRQIDPSLDIVRWRSLPKAVEAIREVQSWRQRAVWEVNPELAFRQMNDGEPLRYGRRSVHGLQERQSLLEAKLPGTERVIAGSPQGGEGRQAARRPGRPVDGPAHHGPRHHPAGRPAGLGQRRRPHGHRLLTRLSRPRRPADGCCRLAAGGVRAMNIDHLRDERVLSADVADVGVTREHSRQRRLYRLLIVGAVVGVWLWVSVLVRHLFGTPHLTHSESQILPLVALVVLVAAVMVIPLLAAGRSPHIRYRPEEIDVSLDDVKGLPVVVEEAVRTLNLFLAHATFRSADGRDTPQGHPVRGTAGNGQDPPGQGPGPGGRGAVLLRVVFRLPVDVLRSDKPEDPVVLRRSCARRPGRRAGRSASSRRSTPSAPPGRGWVWAAVGRASPASSTSC